MTVVAVVDTESTGLGPLDEPVSVGVIVIRVDERGGHMETLGRYEGLREPAVPIHPRAQQVHGLALDDLRGHSFDLAVLSDLLTKADVLIAHNAAFDARMLGVVLGVRAPWRCSYRQFPWPKMRNRKLDTVCAELGVERPSVHGAMRDVKALLDCLLARSGKTDRSRTYLRVLLNKDDFDVRAQAAHASTARRAMEAGVDVDLDRGKAGVWGWIGLLYKAVVSITFFVIQMFVGVLAGLLKGGGRR